MTEGAATTWDYAPATHRPLTQTDYAPAQPDPPSRVLTQAGLRFHAIVTDPIGTPQELVTPTGTLAWSPRTTLWGTPLPTLPNPQNVDCPLRFPGQYDDPETGLHYNYFRHYDPETGRYASPDPLGLKAGWNQHGYVGNPLGWLDPLGLHACAEPDEISKNISQHALQSAQRPDGKGTHFVRGVDERALPYYVDGIINGDTPNVEVRYLSRGRVGYWDTEKEAIVIEDGNGGTVFTPSEGKRYFDTILR
ncbi:RHS repeat-associated core domain-containing protein [Streptomyces sp. HSW2009]|uniref:RHS repeat-associated core domain-containing protein n=1 Tax=Streptomyces sp. HSW2009 TaxID=3142890 RepID=UPI0032ECCCE7